MSEETNQIIHLQLIPVFALRHLLIEMVSKDEEQDEFKDEGKKTETVEKKEAAMQAHIQEVLGIKSTGTAKTVEYLTRDQLVKLVNAHPDIKDDQILALFEEYRYGANPSFFIYLFEQWRLNLPEELEAFGELIEGELAFFNEIKNSVTPPPRLSQVKLYDLTTLGPQNEVIEVTYSILKRLEYIDAAENTVSTYQTLYGFFWLNPARGYWIIYERLREAGTLLRHATENVTGIRLRPLVISKELKNNLPFLERKNLRYSRLHNPDPERDNFLWQSIRDDKPYARQYQELEDSYPEVRNASYQEFVDGKATSVSIRCDQGKLTLSGKFTATQFRTWALQHLEEIIEAHYKLQDMPLPRIKTDHLLEALEISRLGKTKQREYLLEIVAKMLALKMTPYH